MKLALYALVVVACGGGSAQTPTSTPGPAPTTDAERMLALLPSGPQVVLEIDLARLRANPVVGELVAKTLTADLVGEIDPPASPFGAADRARSPALGALATADLIVLAAYGVGTSEAATITLVSSSTEVTNGVPVGSTFYALGPPEWTRQVEARAGLVAAATPLSADADLLRLRDHAFPDGAPGASLRVTARLPADARKELAIQAGLTVAPAQISIWGDVVDDLAIIVDAEIGESKDGEAKAVARLEAAVKRALGDLAELPAVKVLGIPNSLTTARMAVRGTWVRTIVAIGPSHLARVVERATALLEKGPS